MPEIGATLREARMGARIDIAEIEQATKIRAKYLRALENEEWELLPGPTFVKTFLRTYAEALGLDAKLLVDEYKLRHERLSDSELRPIAPRSRGAGGARPTTGSLGPPRLGSPGGGRPSRGPIVAVLLFALIAVLTLIGLFSGGDDTNVSDETAPASTPSASTPATVPPSSGSAPVEKPEPAARRLASLKVLPTGNVNVCLRAEGQGALIDGIDLRAGEDQKTFRSSRFTLTLGNDNARIRWNGKSFTPPASSSPIGYAFTPTGRTRLKAADLPTCGR